MGEQRNHFEVLTIIMQHLQYIFYVGKHKKGALRQSLSTVTIWALEDVVGAPQSKFERSAKIRLTPALVLKQEKDKFFTSPRS